MRQLAAVLAAALIVAIGVAVSANAGFGDFATVVSATESDSKARKVVKVQCPTELRSGGGAAIVKGSKSVALESSGPVGARGWRASAFEIERYGEDWRLKVFAICPS